MHGPHQPMSESPRQVAMAEYGDGIESLLSRNLKLPGSHLGVLIP